MPDSTSITVLDQAIAEHKFRPKGIKIGQDLWSALNAADRIKWKRGYLEGMVDSHIDFPVLDENIFVHVSPELDGHGYDLPQGAE
ncbi:hypothetical protein [Achromobacter veterisilvae]|uniref:hypothetical protein n=1 Tax=Achromobacter veterisilvae TaxID=2069367 RepID=UPI00100DABB0|nr:hypothetical protein [Achromobacter veterisilvae]